MTFSDAAECRLTRQAGAGDLPTDGFEPDATNAFGVKTRRENVTVITWAEMLDIP